MSVSVHATHTYLCSRVSMPVSGSRAPEKHGRSGMGTGTGTGMGAGTGRVDAAHLHRYP
ncbi:hypothetical protein LZC95_44425 [Pendulispora brunnea]|uniref:Uncharacterized protein n=1 Tax=Pendulispora brunnea TaxID=2905690 RepID=A0ABZ2K875_9BACT